MFRYILFIYLPLRHYVNKNPSWNVMNESLKYNDNELREIKHTYIMNILDILIANKINFNGTTDDLTEIYMGSYNNLHA